MKNSAEVTRIKIEKNKKNLNVNNKNKEVCKMESNQKIHCSVGSCKYNDITVQECKLKAINIMPNTNVNTGDEKETMCVSYKNNK